MLCAIYMLLEKLIMLTTPIYAINKLIRQHPIIAIDCILGKMMEQTTFWKMSAVDDSSRTHETLDFHSTGNVRDP